jgi:hypothetical protein
MEPSLSSSPSGFAAADLLPPTHCLNPASEINARFDTQLEVRIYPCRSSQGKTKKEFTVKPEVIEVCIPVRVSGYSFH